MENSKLVRILKSLDKKEMTRFYKFLHSPFYNQRQDVISLFDLLKTPLQEENSLPDKEKLFQHIYPDQKFNNSNFSLLMSYLFQLLKKFLITSELDQVSLSNDLHLAKAYRKKGLNKDFLALSEKMHKELHQNPSRNADYYDLSYRLQWEEHQLLSAEKPTEEAKLLEMAQTIDVHYFILKLRHLCLLNAHQSVYQSSSEVGFSKEILNYIADSELLQIPAIAVYYYYYQLLQKQNEAAAFQQFKQILFESGQQFNATEVRDLYLLAINYCVRCANEGKSEYLEELFELYQQGLKSKSLLEEETLSRFTYHNITGVGLRIGQYEWTEAFINQYKPSLEKRYRESSYSFSLARLEYSRKNYADALSLLQKSNYRDLLLNLAAKTLQLKIYYELSELDLLQSHLEAMKKYILRRHLIGYHKSNYRNIINYAQKLLLLNPYDKKAQQKLVAQLHTEEILSEKNWFLEQLNATK